MAALRTACAPERVFWVGDSTTSAIKAIESASRDMSFHNSATPSAVVFPISTEEVQAVMKICVTCRIPITPRGAGTGLEGGAIPYVGGVVIDVMKMKSFDLLREDMQVIVGPGVKKLELGELLVRALVSHIVSGLRGCRKIILIYIYIYMCVCVCVCVCMYVLYIIYIIVLL